MDNPKAVVKQTGWQFIGFYRNGKTDMQFPIGVYSQYCDGAAQANSWIRQEKRAYRWEGSPIHEEMVE